MKKITLLCLTAFTVFAMGASAQEKKVVLTAEDVTINAGEQAELTVSMDYETNVDVVGFNFYLALPEGVDLYQYYDEDEEEYFYEYNVSSDFIKKSLVTKYFGIMKVANTERTYLFTYADQSALTPLKTTHGELFTITLTAANNALEQCTGTIYDIALSTNVDDGQGGKESVSLDLGNIANYEFAINVIGGVPTGIYDINADEDGAPVYNLGGQRVKTPAKGIFVKGGHKVVKK